ncbi:MAG: helix-turn-helix transcriptional regulator [Gammaproteobacteria bacterium]|nr:helix-turn-helix transcriptional regulator [Gammaproteobacteria bacterium]
MKRQGLSIMYHLRGWVDIEVPDIECLPKAIFPRSQSLLPRQRFPVHSHNWNQFVYATSGTLAVTVARARYVITPEQAIWVPTGVNHSVAALNGVEFRNLYVLDSPDLMMPSDCTVFSVTPLLRELIIELENITGQTKNKSYVDLLDNLILEQLRRSPKMNFHLPWPQSLMLQTICNSLYANPADKRSVDDWGRELGASARTLTRRFENEMGITIREWRFRLRLSLAMEWLCSGRNITEIALDLGYSSTSAFTYMFRKEMGCPPSEWCVS